VGLWTYVIVSKLHCGNTSLFEFCDQLIHAVDLVIENAWVRCCSRRPAARTHLLSPDAFGGFRNFERFEPWSKIDAKIGHAEFLKGLFLCFHNVRQRCVAWFWKKEVSQTT